jgi:hypothetical protein
LEQSGSKKEKSPKRCACGLVKKGLRTSLSIFQIKSDMQTLAAKDILLKEGIPGLFRLHISN